MLLIGNMRKADNGPDTFQSIGMAAERLTKRLRQPRKLPESSQSSSRVGTCGVLLGLESTKTFRFAADIDSGIPISAFSEIDALDPRRSSCWTIRGILRIGSFTKIAEAIVQTITIDMINETERPPTGHMGPGDAMCKDKRVSDADDSITIFDMNRAGDHSRVATIFAPNQIARLREIIQGIPNFGDTELVFWCHDQSEQLLKSNKKQNEDARRDSEPGDGRENKSREHTEYVDQRLRELAAFERRAGSNN
jgi:hypothetical protein